MRAPALCKGAGRGAELYMNFVLESVDSCISINRSYRAFIRKEVASNCKKLSWAGTKQELRSQNWKSSCVLTFRFLYSVFCILSSAMVCSQSTVLYFKFFLKEKYYV